MKTNKTNAARLLDRAKIPYELVPYEVDENNLAATHVAEQLGENIEQVFKTLVLRGDKHGIFVLVSLIIGFEYPVIGVHIENLINH